METAMPARQTKGEMHGCIVCGRLYQLYVIYETNGTFIDSKVMTAGGKRVPNPDRALVACDHHTDKEIERAVEHAYGKPAKDEDE